MNTRIGLMIPKDAPPALNQTMWDIFTEHADYYRSQPNVSGEMTPLVFESFGELETFVKSTDYYR
jgi:hypothetical protein